MEANFTIVESQVLIFATVFRNMRASHNDLGTLEGTPLDDKTYVWDGEHPKGAGYMLTGFVFGLLISKFYAIQRIQGNDIPIYFLHFQNELPNNSMNGATK